VVKAALFDLDGTLIDSNQAVVWCVNELLRSLGLPPADPSEIIALIGVGLTPLLKHFLPDAEAHVLEYRRLYAKGFGDKTTVYEGALDLLMKLRLRGVATGIVTNRNRELAALILGHFKFDDVIDTLVGDGDGLPLKPDPAIVFEACRRLQVDPAQTLMIGDTVIDIETGLNAGCRTVLVDHNNRKSPNDADYTVSSLLEILALL
jgi:phosphoglycolate phosphatase